MKFKIKKTEILSVLTKVQGIAGRKSNLAITENVLIKSTDSGISISATDFETGFEGFYPATVESDGIITINSKKLFEIVRDFPSDEILINEIKNRWFEIGNEKVQYRIVGMNPEDFPDIPYIEDVSFFEISSSEFRKMIEKTVSITGPSDEKRAHIIGTCFKCIERNDNKIIRMISTDGKRLSKTDYICEKNSDLPIGKSILIPKKGLSEVGKFLDSESTVQIGIKDNYFIVKNNNETMIIGLLEGDFPDFDNLFSKEEGYVIEVDKGLFKMMLKRMSILTSEDYKGVIFNFEKEKLIINTANPEIGESKEDLEIEYKGDPVEIAFNPQYFIDTLNFIERDTVFLNIIDNENPCSIFGEKEKNYLSIIMPMKI